MNYLNTKVDYHVHIGQWYDVYYSYNTVLDTLKARGVEEAWFSSTSSELYCKESFDVKNNNSDSSQLPTALELYDFIKNEVLEAIEYGKKINLRAVPLYWVIPEVHFSTIANISIEKAMKEVFRYADKYELPILVHCGCDDFEKPKLFEKFIAKYPNVKVQLAHCKPLEDTLYMLKKYPNTSCDTAFVSEDVQNQIIAAGFGNRIRYGSDFPII